MGEQPLHNYDFGEVDEATRNVMTSNPPEGTGLEERVAGILDKLGVGYEEQVRFSRYRPDFVLEDGTVLNALGDWWHGHPRAHSMDEVDTNEDYWAEKLQTNKERDKRRRRELLSGHSRPMVIWCWEGDDLERVVPRHCKRLGLVDGTLEHRFWSKAEKAGFDECWEWRAAMDRGYGEFGIDGDKDYAHRVAYALWYGKWPDGCHVLHKHDNRSCVNPRHLRLGGQPDNMSDAVASGRQPIGADHPRGRSKVTPEQVRELRGASTVRVGGSYTAGLEAVDEDAGVAVVSLAVGPAAASGIREVPLDDVEPV